MLSRYLAGSLKFSEEERIEMSPTLAFGDAEDILSYGVHCLGSSRIADLILEAENDEIALFALTIDGFCEEDKKRLGATVTRETYILFLVERGLLPPSSLVEIGLLPPSALT